MANELPIERVIEELLSGPFKDLSHKSIVERVKLTDDPSRVHLILTNLRIMYRVEGRLSSQILQEPRLDDILKGMIGHEFAHIVRGPPFFANSLEDFRWILASYVDSLRDKDEKGTDELVIKRGMGEQLYLAKLYIEQQGYGATLSGYNSQEVWNLQSKHAAGLL